MSATVTLRRAIRPGETVAARRHASVPILAEVSGGLRLRLSAPDLPPVFQRQRIDPSPIMVSVAVTVPAIVPGAVDVEPNAVVVPVVFGSPAIEPGAVVLEPAPLDVAAGVPLPSVQPGAVELRPGAVAAPAVVPPPAVLPGPVSVAPAVFKPTVSIRSPVVSVAVALPTYADDFNRADTPLTDDPRWSGSNLVTIVGQRVQTKSNNALTLFNRAAGNTDIGAADHFVEYDQYDVTLVNNSFAVLRYDAATGNYVGCRFLQGSFQIYTLIGGTFTQVAGKTQAIEAGDRIRWEMRGSQAIGFWKGAEQLRYTITAASLLTGRTVGIHGRTNNGRDLLDNWLCGPLA